MLSVAKFKTEEEAIELANDTTYGLGAGLHSSTYLITPANHRWRPLDLSPMSYKRHPKLGALCGFGHMSDPAGQSLFYV